VMAVGFGAVLVAFVAHERRAADPVVNLLLFRIRMFSLSVLSLLLVATTTSARHRYWRTRWNGWRRLPRPSPRRVRWRSIGCILI